VTAQLRLVRCAGRAEQRGVTKPPINASLRAARLPRFSCCQPTYRHSSIYTAPIGHQPVSGPSASPIQLLKCPITKMTWTWMRPQWTPRSLSAGTRRRAREVLQTYLLRLKTLYHGETHGMLLFVLLLTNCQGRKVSTKLPR
jgi:hypothetical protein